MHLHVSTMMHLFKSQPYLDLLGFICISFWLATYVLIILRGKKDRTYGMPFAALCGNIVWEFLYTFVYQPVISPNDPNRTFDFWEPLVSNGLWFVADVFILISWLRYWRTDAPPGVSVRWHAPGLVLALATAAVLFVTLHMAFLEFPVWPNAPGGPEALEQAEPGMMMSFIENLMMSMLFVAMVLRRNNLSGQSPAIAILKMVGTACGGLYFILTPVQDTPFWRTVFILIFLYDMLYLLLLLRLRRGPLMTQAQPAG